MDTEALFRREAKDQGGEVVPWAAWMAWSNDSIPATSARTQDRLRAAVSNPGCGLGTLGLFNRASPPSLGSGLQPRGPSGMPGLFSGEKCSQMAETDF